MNESDMSASMAAYLDHVARLLADVDEEERVSLLADLADELREIPDSAFTERLGTPQDFASEYRRSAGIERPRIVSRRLALGIAGLLGVLVVGFVLTALVTSLSSVATGESAAPMVDLALLSVPVAEVQPIMADPNQFLGIPHSRPNFDTSGFGPDLTLRQAPNDLRPLDPAQALRAVYLGHDQDGEPYYIWYQGSPNLRQKIGQIFADFGSVGRFGSRKGALVTGHGLLGLLDATQEEMIPEIGLTYGHLISGSDQPTVAVMEWHALPTEVAAVVFHLNGEPAGWQTPVSGTAAIRVNADIAGPLGFQPEMVALTADGEMWRSYP